MINGESFATGGAFDGATFIAGVFAVDAPFGAGGGAFAGAALGAGGRTMLGISR